MVSKKVIIIGAAVAVIAIIIGSLYSSYFSGFNSAQGKDENVKNLAANIDAQLQRRYDLIPNLVNTVKGYAAHEKGLLEEVTRLREQCSTNHGTPGEQAATACTPGGGVIAVQAAGSTVVMWSETGVETVNLSA